MPDLLEAEPQPKLDYWNSGMMGSRPKQALSSSSISPFQTTCFLLVLLVCKERMAEYAQGGLFFAGKSA